MLTAQGLGEDPLEAIFVFIYRRERCVAERERKTEKARRTVRALTVRSEVGAADPNVLVPIVIVLNRTVSNHSIDKAGFGRGEAKGAAVTLIQRFASAANLNIHLHALVLDGGYREEGQAVVVHAVSAPTEKEITAVLSLIVTRIMTLLTRAGYVIEEEGRGTVLSDKEEGVLAPLQAASITYRIAYGPRQGQKRLTLQCQASSPAEKKRRRCRQEFHEGQHQRLTCGGGSTDDPRFPAKYARHQCALRQCGGTYTGNP